MCNNKPKLVGKFGFVYSADADVDFVYLADSV